MVELVAKKQCLLEEGLSGGSWNRALSRGGVSIRLSLLRSFTLHSHNKC